MAGKKTKRKVLIPIGIILLIIIVAIALVPVLISRGLGHGLVRNAIEDQINGTADFQQLQVTWFGPQTIRELRLVDDANREAAVLDVSVDQALLPLLFGGRSLDVTVAGVVRSDLYEDGSLSLQQLVKESPDEPDEPLNLQGVPALTVTVAGITALLSDLASGQVVAVEDVSGFFAYVPGDDLSFDLRGITEAGEQRGSMAVSGNAPGLIASDGRLRPEGVPMTVQLAATNIPVPGVDVQSVLRTLSLNVQSQNVAQLISVDVQGDGAVEGEQPSRFSGEFRVRNPIQQDGTIDINLQRVEGEFTGEHVPSSLLQVAFNNTPIVLARDLGRTINLQLQLDPEADGQAVIVAVGERGTVEVSALNDQGWWRGDNLVLRTDQADPELVRGSTGVTIEQPTDLEIVLTSFAVPPVDESLDARPWGFAGASGYMRINGPTTVIMPHTADDDADQPRPQSPPRQVTFSDANVNIDTAELGDALYVTGSMMIEGGELTLDHTITNLADAQGRIDAANAQPIGTLSLANVPTALAEQLMPEQAQIIRETLGPTVSGSVQTQMRDDGLFAQLSASGQDMQINASALRGPDALRLIDGVAEVGLSPALAQRLLEDAMDEPVQLTQAVPIRIELAPTEFPGSPPFDYQWRGVPITAVLSANNVPLANIPGLQEPVSLTNLQATLDAQLDEQWSYGAEGQLALTRPEPNRQVAVVNYTVSAEPRDEQPMSVNAAVTMTQLVVEDIEAMLGQDPGALTNWIGQSGSLRADVQTIENRYEGTLTSELERLTGEFRATLAEQILTLYTDNADITLGGAALENMLAAEGDPVLVDVQQDVPLRLVMQSRMPLSLFTADPYDPKLVEINAEFRGGPLVMVSEGERSTLNDMIMLVRSEVVQDSLDFVINIDAEIAESVATAETGEIDIAARVRDLMSPSAAFDWQGASYDVDATVVRGPTILADAILGLRGYFVSAVGREFNATINSQSFSRDSGTMSMDVSTMHGFLRASGEGDDGRFLLAEGSPLEGELQLTPLLRDRLLSNLHPLLGDIVTMPQPLHLIMSQGSVPLDGDISQMNGELVLSIGEVEFNAQSPMFAMLRAARVAEVSRLNGVFEPIHAQIRDGIVIYDQFLVTIDGLEIPYRGQIDLNTRSINLRTTLPLGELLVTGIREVPEEARMIAVPLITRGSLSDFSTEIDPEFDLAGALVEAGLQRGLQELLPRDRLPFDFRDLLPRR